MADAAPAPAPTPAAPPNGATPPKPVKPGPVVEVKPKPGASATPPGEQMVEFPDHKGEMIRMTAKEAAAYIHRGKSAQETLTKWDKKRAEFEKREAEFSARVERLKSDPSGLKAFLAEIGADPHKLGQSLVLEEIEEGKLTEDQKALREERRKREELEAREKQREEDAAQQALQAEVEQHYNELSNLFIESLKAAEIPEEMAPDLFPRMASLYRAVKNAGHEPDPRMFAQHLKAKLDSLLQKRASSLPLEELEGFIGKRKWKPADDAEEQELDYAEIVHRRKLAALKAKRAGVPGMPATPAAASKPSTSPMSLPAEVVSRMPGDAQNAYWAMQRASAEELPGRVERFKAAARKAGVKI